MTVNSSVMFIALASVVWSFGLDLFRPVRKFVMRRTYFKKFRRMLKDSSNLPEKDKGDLNSSCCPSCRLPFDKGKKRRLIDTCGHQRCYTCIFTTDHCPLCQPQTQPKTQPARRPNSFLFPRQTTTQSRPNTISIDNQQQLAKLAEQRLAAPYVTQKIQSCWIAGNRSHSNQEISKVEVHAQMDLEMLENVISTKHPFLSQSKEKQNSRSGKSNRIGRKTCDVVNSSPGSTLSSASSRKDLCASRQNLRSREQSVTSLMSISSRSSSVPMDILKEVDERESECNPRFSLTQSSTISLNFSSDVPSNGPTEKVLVLPLRLKPLYFEVPQPEPDSPFLGRHWLFKEIEKILLIGPETAQGLIISGCPGSGKTSLILQLVDYSCFGRKWEEAFYQTTQDIYWKIRDLANTCTDGDQMSISSRGSWQKVSEAAGKEAIHHLASRVVGYHFCQAEYNSTCLIPDFVHSLAAQLCQAPQLVEFRDLLLKEPRYQNLLCLDSCLADPNIAFIKGILEPLNLLVRNDPADNIAAIVVVDSVHEAERYRSASDESIASFLAKHMPLFPKWLKLIVTTRSTHEDIVSSFPLQSISLDMGCNNFNIQQDLLSYIDYRINASSRIQSNINNVGRKDEECVLSRFSEYLASVSNGSFLYTKLTLDLLHQGYLVIKSSSFSVIPVHLRQAFMLTFNLKFSSASSFDKVRPILEVCLASLYPLTVLEVYHSLNARYRTQSLPWFEFLQRLEVITAAQILVHRRDGSLMVCHPSMREWLISRNRNEGKKFLCDARCGHINLSLRMARLEAPLSPEQGLELAQHLLAANAFENSIANDCTGNLQSLWLQHCLLDTSGSLAHERNIFSPNITISRMLLQAGANPNMRVGSRGELPLLTMAADVGLQEFVTLLLEFGADYSVQNQDDGITPLIAACRRGHQTIVQALLSVGAKVHLKDGEGKTALTHAAEKGCLAIINLLLKSPWPEPFSFNSAVSGAFVTAAGKGHVEVCQCLMAGAEIQVNASDPVSNHTALTFASWQGHMDVCKFLLQKGATLVVPSRKGVPPIIWAVRGGHLAVVKLMISQRASLMQTDREGKTPLIWAATVNNMEILSILVNEGAAIDTKDFEGLTALAWACIENQVEAAQCLLEHKAQIESLDVKGRTPLTSAAKHRNGEMINLLLKHGANMEHRDYSGNSPLDEAMITGNLTAVSKFLHHGVKLGPKVWSAAQGQPNMLLVLLHKLLSDGVVLYKKEKLQEASQRFQYALKKFPPEEAQGEKKVKFQQLRFYLQLGLSRCDRKMKEYESSIQAADEALKIRPESYEALYVRAKAKHEACHYQEALEDVTHALRVSQSDARIQQILQNLRADILTSSKVVCPLDGIDVDNNRVSLPLRPKSGVPKTEVSLTKASQPCRTVTERQQNSIVHTMPEKKLSFCASTEMTVPVH